MNIPTTHTRSLLLAFVCLGLFGTSTTALQAQHFAFRVDDQDGIPPHVYAERRARLLDSLPTGSIAIIFSADVRNRQNDVDYAYRQNSDLLYLTGFPFPNSALVLTKDPVAVGDTQTHQVFFTRERNADREQWQGVTAGPDEAQQVYGLTPARPMSEFTEYLDRLLGVSTSEAGQEGHDTISPLPTGNRHELYLSGWATKSVPMPLIGKNFYVDSQIKKELQERFGTVDVVTPIPALIVMRQIKDTAELRLIRKAVDITVLGHKEAMKGAKAATHEYEIEALMEYTFKRLGAESVGYPSIVGSNYNACILHYTSNRRQYNTGDMVLADCGAEYHGYTADITRTFPITGVFTPEQRIIYNIVLEAQDSGIAACRAGAPFKAPHNAAHSVIERRLIELGIIENASQVKTYFMHGTSHYLGLDVHDVGTRGALEPNMVITVEPGIYIPEGSACDKKWWNIGVRIEDDVLITTSDPDNLSSKLPRSADGIEQLMQETKTR